MEKGVLKADDRVPFFCVEDCSAAIDNGPKQGKHGGRDPGATVPVRVQEDSGLTNGSSGVE